MKAIKLVMITIVFFGVSCSKHDRPKKDPISIKFNQPDLFPEGVVYDPFNNYFLVSSITRGDIGMVTTNGTYTPFITDDALASSIGLEIDKTSKRLLVVNSSLMTSLAQLAIYNLNSRERIHLVDLGALLPGAPHFTNDVAVDAEGNAYVTDSFSPVIYKVDAQGNATIFFRDESFATDAGQFGFNGIEYHPDGFLLVAFNIRNQIVKIPLNKSAYSIVQLNAGLNSPDGLIITKNAKQLVVVNNGEDPEAHGKVILFSSDDKWETGHVTDIYETGPVFPTTATTDGKKVYTLYAYLNILIAGGTQSTFTIQEVPFHHAHSL